MYTVNIESLPDNDCAQEAAVLMRDTLEWAAMTRSAMQVSFYGEVYENTSDTLRFTVACYSGRVVGITIEPPSFTLSVEDAALQIAECSCPSLDPNDIFDNPEQLLLEEELSSELDVLVGAETQDPHYEAQPHLIGSTISIRFDRLGSNIVSGVLVESPE